MKHLKLFVGVLISLFVNASYGFIIFSDERSTLNINGPVTTFIPSPASIWTAPGSTANFNNQSSVGGSNIINGTLRKKIGGTLSGNSLFFEGGIYSDGDFEVRITGTYDPTNTYSIKLIGADSKFDVINPGVISERIVVSNSGSRIEGQPSFRTPNAILLSSDITFDLLSELDSSIDLGGGTVILGGDLALSDGIKFNGIGEVEHRGFNLILGQKDLLWTDTIRFENATNLELGSENRVTGIWGFYGDAHIVGNNFSIDLKNGGKMVVGKNTTVRMSNLIITGLGTGAICFTDTSSKLELFNVAFDMDAFVTYTTGGICAVGPTTVVTRNNLLKFDLAASLTVDRTKIIYDTLDFNDNNNICFTSLTNNLTFTNGGIIRNINGIRVGDHLTSVNKKLDREFVVSPLRRLVFDSSATINGDGFFYQFARDPEVPIVVIEDGNKAVFENILMTDFPVEKITIGEGSQLFFGHNTFVELGENGVLTNSWQFEGKTVLNGGGRTLILGNCGRLVLRPGSSLLLDNIVIKGVEAESLICLDNRCTVSFGNVIWQQDEDYSFTQGCFEVTGLWEIQGTSTFSYETSKKSTITKFGTLRVDKNSTLYYEPPIADRDLICMEDEFAILHLRGGDLSSSTTGLRLTKGTLFATELCEVRNDGATAESEGISFGNGTTADDLTVRIDAGATLEVMSGIVVYDNDE